MSTAAYRLILCCCLLLAVTACGKKPSFVDAPPSANVQSNTTSDTGNDTPDKAAAPSNGSSKKQKDQFPHTYPKPWL